ncbi:MAG: hypothetical protein NVSMB66_1010 [Candidatus Doudnabacteria bacterium]
MSDADLVKELEQLKAAKAENKEVDISALMLSALEKEQENKVPTPQKLRAYFISLAFPPFGLIYAVRFYFSGSSDGKKTALYCVLLTIFVIALTTFFFNLILSSGNTSVQQIQTIKPADIRNLYQ